MHKATHDMSKGFQVILDVAEELEQVIQSRAQTPDAAVTALAVAAGRIAAKYDLSVGLIQELVAISFRESKKAADGGQA